MTLRLLNRRGYRNSKSHMEDSWTVFIQNISFSLNWSPRSGLWDFYNISFTFVFEKEPSFCLQLFVIRKNRHPEGDKGRLEDTGSRTCFETFVTTLTGCQCRHKVKDVCYLSVRRIQPTDKNQTLKSLLHIDWIFPF